MRCWAGVALGRRAGRGAAHCRPLRFWAGVRAGQCGCMEAAGPFCWGGHAHGTTGCDARLHMQPVNHSCTSSKYCSAALFHPHLNAAMLRCSTHARWSSRLTSRSAPTARARPSSEAGGVHACSLHAAFVDLQRSLAASCCAKRRIGRVCCAALGTSGAWIAAQRRTQPMLDQAPTNRCVARSPPPLQGLRCAG